MKLSLCSASECKRCDSCRSWILEVEFAIGFDALKYKLNRVGGDAH